MYVKEANEIIRKAIVEAYFIKELQRRGYKKVMNHTLNETYSKDDSLPLRFGVTTGNEYPDGDEWFIVEYFVAQDIELPDNLKSPDYFTRLTTEDGKTFWRHRELIRYRSGKIKRLDEALEYIERKYSELKHILNELLKSKEKTRKKG